MENKINIAELLKDCPQGMELDCTMVDDVTFYGIGNEETIVVKRELVNLKLYLDRYGAPVVFPKEDLKCVIFPKGKTTWDGFVPPREFKDGDIVVNNIGKPFILKFYDLSKDNVCTYCGINCWDNFEPSSENWTCARDICYATEKEKQKLFDAIKANGYKWDEETKTLEELPKFKVGDRIRKKGENSTFTITDVNEAHYFCGKYVICDTCDNNWELVPDKFDINTLVPFESRVLIRDYEENMWVPAFWGCILDRKQNRYLTTRGAYEYCIPYEGNEHLLGKTDDCSEFYKNW